MTDAEINDAVCLAIGERATNKVDYANSLDAIVPVVREWMQKEVPFSFHSASIEYDAGDDAKSRECFRASIMGRTHYTKDNPARALCLAFLQAVKETP